MIRLEDITKEFPDKVLFTASCLAIKPGMRIGLVGPNGSGKTTLLRIMLGDETVDQGNVLVDKGTIIGYLPQDIIPGSGRSILEEVMKSFPAVAELEENIYQISQALVQDHANTKMLNKLSRLQQEYERLEGWSLEDRAGKILSGLGFKVDQFHLPMEVFSGGWRMRVALAGILLLEPDILFLDEPTNHLDLEAIIWLENFLSSWKGGLVMISHDRSFLDQIVTHIVEIEQARIKTFTGNYSSFQEQKQLRLEQQAAAYRNQQRKIAETERFIERFRYKNTKATQVQSRVKQLEKLERIEAPDTTERKLKVFVPQPGRAPQKVADFRQAAKAYETVSVYSRLDYTVERGQKIGLVGPNGAGKSTLLKMLAGEEALTDGELEFGNGVDRAYFAQHQLEILDPGKTVYETIENETGDWTVSQIRGYLGSFLFPGDAVDKRVQVLSGGEKSRLALARMLVSPAHLLLLDEPTNHLDMISRDVVEDVLSNYQGTLVCISHDRHFLNTVTDTTVEIKAGRVRVFPGNYDYYCWKTEQSVEVDDSGNIKGNDQGKNDKHERIKARKNRRRLENELKAVERQLPKLEAAQKEQIAIYNDPANVADYQKINAALDREREIEAEYLELLERMEEIEGLLLK